MRGPQACRRSDAVGISFAPPPGVQFRSLKPTLAAGAFLLEPGISRAAVSLCRALTEIPRYSAAPFAPSHPSCRSLPVPRRSSSFGASRSASRSSAASSSEATISVATSAGGGVVPVLRGDVVFSVPQDPEGWDRPLARSNALSISSAGACSPVSGSPPPNAPRAPAPPRLHSTIVPPVFHHKRCYRLPGITARAHRCGLAQNPRPCCSPQQAVNLHATTGFVCPCVPWRTPPGSLPWWGFFVYPP